MFRIANSLPSFTSLTSADQVSLLKENADLIVSLRGAIFFDKKKKGMDQILSSIGTSTSENIEIELPPEIRTHSDLFFNILSFIIFCLWRYFDLSGGMILNKIYF